MSVYSLNRQSSLGTYAPEEVGIDESYFGMVGSYRIMIENVENDLAIFEGVIKNDFQEAAILAEGVETEEKVAALQEASLGGFIDKIKQFIKKVWAKIQGIFHTFITKMSSLIVRNNKKFVEMHKKNVVGKDLSKIKYKWANAKKGEALNSAEFIPLTKANATAEINATVRGTLSSDPDTESKALSDPDIKDKSLKSVSGVDTTYADFSKDFHKALFDDVEDVTGLSSQRLTNIIGWLSDDKALESIKKENSTVNKIFSDMLKIVDSARNTALKDIPGGDGSIGSVDIGGTKANYNKGDQNFVKRLNNLYKSISISQEVLNKVVAANMTEFKFMLAQCRRVFAQAAAFNPKSVKEDAILIDAIGESAEYEFYSDFE